MRRSDWASSSVARSHSQAALNRNQLPARRISVADPGRERKKRKRVGQTEPHLRAFDSRTSSDPFAFYQAPPPFLVIRLPSPSFGSRFRRSLAQFSSDFATPLLCIF